jgi:HSP20 family molecular chaperone IbpA
MIGGRVNYFQKEMPEVYETYFGRESGFTEFGEETWVPYCDIFETPDHVVVIVELARCFSSGCRSYSGGEKAQSDGQRKEPPYASKESYHLMEIHFGPFYREIVYLRK